MTARALRMLYREIPEVTGCKDGCGKCCGPVPWSPAELDAVADKVPPGAVMHSAPGGEDARMVLLISPTEFKCAMLGPDKRCTVYERRPLMCRLFAAAYSPGLTCPFGAMARRPLRDQKATEIVNRYKAQAP